MRGFGMLNKLVFGRDSDGKLFFKTDGTLPGEPDVLAKEKKSDDKPGTD